MKKYLALILALALASISFAAFADELPVMPQHINHSPDHDHVSPVYRFLHVFLLSRRARGLAFS